MANLLTQSLVVSFPFVGCQDSSWGGEQFLGSHKLHSCSPLRCLDWRALVQVQCLCLFPAVLATCLSSQSLLLIFFLYHIEQFSIWVASSCGGGRQDQLICYHYPGKKRRNYKDQCLCWYLWVLCLPLQGTETMEEEELGPSVDDMVDVDPLHTEIQLFS